MNAKALAIAAVLAAIPPIATGTTAPDCAPSTDAATEVDGFYIRGSELWQESNGVSGLQRVDTICEGGVFVAKDTCIIHKQTSALTYCANSFGQKLS